MTLAATYYGANGWLLEFDDLRVLVDPWLRGSLSFPPGEWLLKGELPCERKVPEKLNLLLLTQGLADHAHPDTLALLPKDLPVIGSAAAARVVERLGFTSVKALSPGESTNHQGLRVRASAGAPVPMVENGYLLDWSDGSLYLEPHGVLDPSLRQRRVNTLITPVVDLGLPLAGNFITGASVLTELVERFQPDQILASTTGGDVQFTGLISRFLQGTEPAKRWDATAITTPEPGTPIMLAKAQG